MESRFDANIIEYWLLMFVCFVMLVFTLGLALPWVICIKQRWLAKHTVINGRRLTFTGTGADLLMEYIVIWILSIITAGIYLLWGWLRIQRWKVRHTHFEEPVTVEA